jgi:ferredoxin
MFALTKVDRSTKVGMRVYYVINRSRCRRCGRCLRKLLRFKLVFKADDGFWQIKYPLDDDEARIVDDAMFLCPFNAIEKCAKPRKGGKHGRFNVNACGKR